ncbi:hypothetical protein Sjap_008287 [Stephania japonica]|uniref:Retrotransposon protein n=1 Tax=Stephania japonica TaxID=461633 RepID=A0AAP0PAR0_9MAGN
MNVAFDDLEIELDEATIDEEESEDEDEEEYMIQHVESTVEWNNFRMNNMNGVQRYATFSSGRRTNVVQSLGRARLRWIVDQDIALVTSLVNLMNMGGWKLDNGTFKGGYQNELELLMKEKLARLRNKPFPFYDELDYVYGKDRATGACVENPTDAVEDITLNGEKHQFQYVASSFNKSQNVEQEENSPMTPISAYTT